MRIIITGGTGLIGRALAESLATDRHDVIVLSRSPEKAILPAGVRAERWDGRTASGWGALADGADAIVNLAGESIGGENRVALMTKRWTPERKQLIRSSRVNAGRAVKQAIEAAKQKPRVLIQASAVGYCGVRDDDEITEDTPAAVALGGLRVARSILAEQGVPDKFIHKPWEMPVEAQRTSGCVIGQDYPAPIVNHVEARERVLAAYRDAKL